MKSKKKILLSALSVMLIAIATILLIVFNSEKNKEEIVEVDKETILVENETETSIDETIIVSSAVKDAEVEISEEITDDSKTENSEEMKEEVDEETEDMKDNTSNTTSKPSKPSKTNSKNETVTSKDNTTSKNETTVPTPTEPTTPVIPTTPTNPTPTTGVIGEDLSFTGSIYLPNAGINIPTLNKFNYAGLASEETWAGDESKSQLVWNNMQTIFDSAADFNIAYDNIGVTGNDSNRFTIDGYAIYWNFNGFGSTSDMELFRRTDLNEYVLSINMEIKSGMIMDGSWDLSLYGQDVLLYLCSLISSDPQNLYNNIYKDLYIDFVFNEESYVRVGDCLVKVSSETSASHYVYYIKQK